MSNASASAAQNGTFDQHDITANGTHGADRPSVMNFFKDVDFLLLELKLIGSAMGIIYLGAHAALRRPPSAAPAKAKKRGQKQQDKDDDDTYDDENRFSQGLEPSDAILFPLMAAILLVGLYYLIQWLQDPAILNKVLQWYVSTMSIASLMTLYAHGIQLVTSLVFPRYWREWSGALRRVDQKTKSVSLCDGEGNVVGQPVTATSPLPRILGYMTFSNASRNFMWKMRSLLTRHWVLKVFVRGLGQERAKVKFAHMMAMLLALGTALVYFSTTSPFLSNMLGYGMCYGSFLVISPTDFLTGALVLSGLFIYDIVMVFYTPYMVTVATTLDVPIKLTFEAAARKSILGLGDIVLPGMFIAWTLRLDLWLFYLRKTKYEATDLKIVEKDASTGDIVTRVETKHREIKAKYVSSQGQWGDRLWTGAMTPFGRKELPFELRASQFPKVYFSAAMVGYFLGMAVTLSMLLVFKRGQPALLYLVPGVLGAVVLTALIRGEFKELWRYTEDGSEDTEEVVVELDADGKLLKSIGQLENGVVDLTKTQGKSGAVAEKKGSKAVEKVEEQEEEKSKGGGAEIEKKRTDGDKKSKEKKGEGHQVLLISIETPKDEME